MSIVNKLLPKCFYKNPTASKFITNCAYSNRKIVPLQRPLSSCVCPGRVRPNHFHSHSVAVSVGLGRDRWTGCVYSKSYGTVLTEAKAKMPERKPFERLPTTVKPKHYKLVLTPDLKTFIFKGEVSVQIEVRINICRREYFRFCSNFELSFTVTRYFRL